MESAARALTMLAVFAATYKLLSWLTVKKDALDRKLTAYGDIPITFRMAMPATLVTGRSGSGKTTALVPVMQDVMGKCGFLGFTIKNDEPAQMCKVAAKINKTPILFGCQHNNRINILRYAYHLGGTEGAVGLITALADIRRGGKDSHGKSFFTDAMANDVRYAVTILAASDNLTMASLGKLVRSAPAQPGMVVEDSPYVKFHDLAVDRLGALTLARRLDIEEAFTHFEYSRASWAADTRTSVAATLSSVLEPFQLSPTRELLCTETNFTPAVLDEGAVILLVDSVQDGGVRALMEQASLRYVAFLWAASRPANQTQPVAFWTDEAHRLLLRDQELTHLATCRSHNVMNYLIVQDYDQIVDAMGKDRAGSVIANAPLRIALAGDNPETVNQIIKSAGESLHAIPAPGDRKSFDPTDTSADHSTQAGVRFEYRPNLTATCLSSLRVGGKHGFCEALVYLGGRPFRSTCNHAFVRMKQRFL